MDLVLIRLVDMNFNGVFSDVHRSCIGYSGGSGFNQIGGHELQRTVHRSSP